MANNFQSTHDGNTRGSFNLFFNDRIIEKIRGRREHAKEIFGIYNKWSLGESEVNQPSIDNSIQVDHIMDTSFQKDIPQVFPIIDEKNDEPDIEQMALIHLKSYPKTYEKYDNMLKFLTQMENDKKEIDDSIKKGIKSRLGIDNNNELEEMLRYYYDVMSAYRNLQEGLPFRRDDFLSTYGMTIAGLNKPLPIDDETISQHISLIYPEVIEKLDKINKKIPNYNNLIFEFRKSLQHINAKWVLGLKGKCLIEEELNPWYRLKRRLKRVNVP